MKYYSSMARIQSQKHRLIKKNRQKKKRYALYGSICMTTYYRKYKTIRSVFSLEARKGERRLTKNRQRENCWCGKYSMPQLWWFHTCKHLSPLITQYTKRANFIVYKSYLKNENNIHLEKAAAERQTFCVREEIPQCILKPYSFPPYFPRRAILACRNG